MTSAALIDARDAVDDMRVQISLLEHQHESERVADHSRQLGCLRSKLIMLEYTVGDLLRAPQARQRSSAKLLGDDDE